MLKFRNSNELAQAGHIPKGIFNNGNLGDEQGKIMNVFYPNEDVIDLQTRP